MNPWSRARTPASSSDQCPFLCDQIPPAFALDIQTGRCLEQLTLAEVTAEYNSTNQLTTETRTTPGKTTTTSYSYDRNGNRTGSTVPGGPAINYTYTPDNQTESVTRND